jgi:hypothetical protein
VFFGQLQPHPDLPDVFGFEWSFLVDGSALFQAGRNARMAGKFVVSIMVPPIHHALPYRQPDVDKPSYHMMLRRICGLV